ncbi:MAG: HupE/UreJ family protein [Pseudomonadota bacterium]
MSRLHAYNTPRFSRYCAAFTLTALLASPAFAHVGLHDAVGLAAGFAHPLSGLDHVLAMVAVGIWAAQMQGSAKWILPLTFPLMMVVGALPGLMGIALPGIEMGIAASVVVLGCLVAFAIRLPTALGAALVALFATLHGYAHGAELPQQASAALYAAGFVAATALLHMAGLSLGQFAHSTMALRGVRLAGAASGAAIAACGVLLTAGAM